MVKEQRKMDRRNFSYYMPVTDADSSKQVGIMTDISLIGFKLDSRQPIPKGQVNHLRLDLTYDLAPQASLVITGQSRWCHPDYVEPTIYNVGFEIVNLAPDEKVILQRVYERYGSKNNGIVNNNGNYLWK